MIIKGFLLDLDGVITDTAEYHFLAWKELASELGIVFDRKFNECLKGVSRMDSLELILKHGNVLNDYSSLEKEQLAEKKNRRYVEMLQQLTQEDVLPGIRLFLHEARENGIKLAVASASKNAPFIIRALGLESEIDFIADAGKIAHSKPYPDIFLAAAEGLNLLACECVGIEDAAAGIQAIHAAKMQAIGIGEKEALSNADLFIASTKELSFLHVMRYFSNKDAI